MKDIPRYNNFVKIESINKGMSSDKKYYIETDDEARLLLRVSGIAEHDRKKSEFEFLQQVYALGVPTCQPIDFGTCNNGKNVYQLLTWVEGEEIEKALPNLSEAEQYDLGLQAGNALRLVHSVPAPKDIESWARRYFCVINERLESFHKYGDPFEGDKIILNYLENNRHALTERPQCYHHGDFHEGNIILSPEGKLYIIDWHTVDFDNLGDPWYEFNRLDCTKPHFATGQLRGYFKGEPPKDFWKLLAYYQAASAITSIVWAKYHAPEELSRVMKMNRDVLAWYDGFNHIIPSWYKSNLPGKCYCGHDCSRCITYQATINNDETLKKQTQAFYKSQFGYDVSIDDVHCLGGRSAEVFALCKDCPFMKCCKENDIAACTECKDYPCKEISDYEEKCVNKYHQIDEEQGHGV